MAHTEKLASIKFGSSRFNIYITPKVENFLRSKSIESQKLIPSSPSWYSTILENLGASHEEEKNLDVVFFGIKGKAEDNLPEDYSSKFESPLRFKGEESEEEEIVKFACKISE